MEVGLSVGLSGQLALERRLSTIANNVANAGTAGFRAEGVHFSAIVSATQPFQTSFATPGAPHVDVQSGGFTKAGNPLDVAIQGESFMAIMISTSVSSISKVDTALTSGVTAIFTMV